MKLTALVKYFWEALMKNDLTTRAVPQKTKYTVKIGKTVFIVSHVFEPNQTRQDVWLSIITRAEGLKAVKN